ncbi:hypothetical protein LVJ94_14985 [Pendulispora rubella]|uniref:Uncharacterized protein n=1 Tax=Pendulispora rubella TaxID=2741070 RepID=A0ABZ2LCB1_9BACT
MKHLQHLSKTFILAFALAPAACAGTGHTDPTTERHDESLTVDGALDQAVDDAFAFALTRLRDTVAFVKQTHPDDAVTYYPTNTFTSGAELGQWNFRPRNSPVVSSRVEDWRSGYFPGTLWVAYRETGEDDIAGFARDWTAGIQKMVGNPIDHDIGQRFLYGFGRALDSTGDAEDPDGSYRAHAREMLVAGAATLDRRFNQGGIPAGALRALDDYPEGPYPVYIDSMMNVPLLFQAATWAEPEQAKTWRAHALEHSLTVLENNLRANGSTYHISRYNDGTSGTPADGKLFDKITDQGYGAETTWSRGQAWAIHGFATVHRLTCRTNPAAAERFLEAAEKAADYFIAHLPANDTADPYNHREGDFVPPSDFDASRGEPDGPYSAHKPATNVFTERDASAAAVAASGLLDLSRLSHERKARKRYRVAAENILRSLLTFRGPDGKLLYLAKDSPHRGLLANGSVAWGSATNSLIYGDYFFLEAMGRYRKR